MSGRFAGLSVMISGAASGFGRLAATRMAAEGARLSLGDVDAAGLAEVAQECPGAVTHTVDVTDEADQRAWVDATVAAFGGIDIALNNAGIIAPMARIGETDMADFDRTMAVNVRGVFLGLKHQLPVMATAGGGAVLNTASAAGLVGAGMMAAYTASKHAVVGLTRAAADEYARFNVRVNAICPAFATTPMFDGMAGAMAEARDISTEAAGQRITGRVPLRRVATADEVITVMLSLVDPANSFMTGQAVAVDGGLSAV